MDHYTKGKRKIERELDRLRRKWKITNLYINEMRDLNEYVSSDMSDKVKDTMNDIVMLRRRLTCKHKNTRTEETVSHHNGDISTDIYCTDCNLILDSY